MVVDEEANAEKADVGCDGCVVPNVDGAVVCCDGCVVPNADGAVVEIPKGDVCCVGALDAGGVVCVVAPNADVVGWPKVPNTD